MNEYGQAYMIRGLDDFIDDAYCEIAARGYSHAVVFDGTDIEAVKSWLAGRHIDFADRIGVFGFKSERDAELFKRRFATRH